MSKYARLASFLDDQDGLVEVSFGELEEQLGFKLPTSARKHRPWWGNHSGNPQAGNGWLKAGYKVDALDLANETVRFQPRPDGAPSNQKSTQRPDGPTKATTAQQPLHPEDAQADTEQARLPATEKLQRVYELLALLPRYHHTAPRAELPDDGVYVFYERGQTARLDDWTVDRVTRIGTHRADGNFPGRIRQHYGNKTNLSGNKNASVFRKHVGGALLRKQDPHDARIEPWLTQGGKRDLDVEEHVSRVLRSRFTFTCITAPTKEDRMMLERGLIGLLAQHGPTSASPSWLGHHAESRKIQNSGLWNTQHTSADPLTDAELNRLEALVEKSVPRTGDGGNHDRLVVVPCGTAKIWDNEPTTGPTQASKAYTGAPATVNQNYARCFGDAWVILSAKYGLIQPTYALPGPYDVTFKRRATGPVPTHIVRDQAEALGLERFSEAFLLGGKTYREVAREAFSPLGLDTEAPFAGMRIGEAMSAINDCIDAGNPQPD